MEGLLPIPEAASELLSSSVANRGNIYLTPQRSWPPSNPNLWLLSAPLGFVLFALLLQPVGNQTPPFVDLAAGTYMLAVAVPVRRLLIIGSCFRNHRSANLHRALAPLITQSATQAG